MSFSMVPLPSEYASRIRSAGCDDFGNEFVEQISGEFGPCRVSLSTFKPADYL